MRKDQVVYDSHLVGILCSITCPKLILYRCPTILRLFELSQYAKDSLWIALVPNRLPTGVTNHLKVLSRRNPRLMYKQLYDML